MVIDYQVLTEDANNLAERMFGHDTGRSARFIDGLMEICSRSQGRDFLIIHNPGGWGTTATADLLQWERSIVEGVCTTMQSLGYDCSSMQYFRSGRGFRAIMEDIWEQTHFFTWKARIMAAQLEFVTRHFDNLRVIMIGVSQGAAFSNAVSQNLNGQKRVSSIELGMPFIYKSRRVLGERTLILDSNGLMPDAMMDWNVPTILRAYLSAPFRWVKFRLQGKPVKFTYCINLPGHDYNWDYPEVHEHVSTFLKTKFGNKR